MSAGGAFGGARGYQPKPPDKGVFPLDHFGECKTVKEQYLACLKEHANEAEGCRDLAKAYLECRMERNLMARQDLGELGFRDKPAGAATQQEGQQGEQGREGQSSKEKRRAGFVAGLPMR